MNNNSLLKCTDKNRVVIISNKKKKTHYFLSLLSLFQFVQLFKINPVIWVCESSSTVYLNIQLAIYAGNFTVTVLLF